MRILTEWDIRLIMPESGFNIDLSCQTCLSSDREWRYRKDITIVKILPEKN